MDLEENIPADNHELLDMPVSEATCEHQHYLTDNVNVDDERLPDENPVEGAPDWVSTLSSFSDLFSEGIGITDLAMHNIQTSDDVPVNLPAYRTPIHLKEKAIKLVKDMLEQGIIKHSNSNYSSPVILVKKKDSDMPRLCIDYTALNKKQLKMFLLGLE